MDTIWFYEDLALPPDSLEDFTRMARSLPADEMSELAGLLELHPAELSRGHTQAIDQALRQRLKGTIVVHVPHHRPLTPEEAAAQMLAHGYMVKFGLEFNLKDLHACGWRFTDAWFRTNFTGGPQEQFRVVAVLPERLYEGEPRKVSFKLSPSIGLGEANAELGEAGVEMTGQVAPVMLGFLGEEQRSPYWELRTGPKPIEGIYNFCALVEAPAGSRLSVEVLAEADVQVKKWGFPVGPQERAWGRRIEPYQIS
ncbi:MAG: hypothetical protein JXB15_10325 [Anaerolineales bacterium]|nr:hypothetical protein [Anaerolineales bacterium]